MYMILICEQDKKRLAQTSFFLCHELYKQMLREMHKQSEKARGIGYRVYVYLIAYI